MKQMAMVSKLIQAQKSVSSQAGRRRRERLMGRRKGHKMEERGKRELASSWGRKEGSFMKYTSKKFISGVGIYKEENPAR
jgi:hypothetical protein